MSAKIGSALSAYNGVVRYSIPNQEIGTAATPLGLRVSMGDKHHLLSCGSQGRLPFENAIKITDIVLCTSFGDSNSLTLPSATSQAGALAHRRSLLIRICRRQNETCDFQEFVIFMTGESSLNVLTSPRFLFHVRYQCASDSWEEIGYLMVQWKEWGGVDHRNSPSLD
ncbi:hypothetical protein EVAR_101905_1 [Eumeta japonica]|uniref:Uncharacterized protein n=1 Tax=Eumeta variegata TaxID=151549 RepID=A0A4C1TSB1_EUMVA|nr:hypothetical protein EVAR_101905_1 [Eumeta japonica]